MTDSHYRKIRKSIWHSSGRPPDAVIVGDTNPTLYTIHCAGSRETWESKYGKIGSYLADRVMEVPAADRSKILRRLTLENGELRRRPMSEGFSTDAVVLAENVPPHLWLGQSTGDV